MGWPTTLTRQNQQLTVPNINGYPFQISVIFQQVNKYKKRFRRVEKIIQDNPQPLYNYNFWVFNLTPSV